MERSILRRISIPRSIWDRGKNWDLTVERGPLAPAAAKPNFRAKTRTQSGELSQPPGTDPVYISTHPPHPRWWLGTMRLASETLASRRNRRSRNLGTSKWGNGWSEKTIDQRKLLWDQTTTLTIIGFQNCFFKNLSLQPVWRYYSKVFVYYTGMLFGTKVKSMNSMKQKETG